MKVECYSGYRGDERPLRFYLGETVHEVLDVVDRWYGPEATYFRVTAGDGNTYILRNDITTGEWTLEAFRRE